MEFVQSIIVFMAVGSLARDDADTRNLMAFSLH